jgi:hypothetical protein
MQQTNKEDKQTRRTNKAGGQTNKKEDNMLRNGAARTCHCFVGGMAQRSAVYTSAHTSRATTLDMMFSWQSIPHGMVSHSAWCGVGTGGSAQREAV